MTNRRPATQEEARALAHPLRLRIIRLCVEGALTNKELAERLGVNPATVLHHVRTLERTGFLEAGPERRGRRGARERPYRSTGKSWTIDVGRSPSVTLTVLDAVRAEVLEAADVRDPMVMSIRIALRLTREDQHELRERVQALVEEYLARQHATGEPLGYLFLGHRRPPP